MEKDVFICHASEDKHIVNELEDKFRIFGISTWVDNNEITWGDSITSTINVGLRNSKYVVAIISKAFNLKNWPQAEMNSMLSIEISSGETRLLPLFIGTDEDIKELRKQYPLLHSKLFIKWDNNAESVATEIFNKLKKKRKSLATNKDSLSNDNNVITTLYWAGEFSEATVKSELHLHYAIEAKQYNLACLFLSNLILIDRGRGKFSNCHNLLKTYLPKISKAKIDTPFKIRLFKELFVLLYEIEDFKNASYFFDEIQNLNPDYKIHTPADDWLPGVLMWRKAHLDIILSESKTTYENSKALSMDSIAYLTDVLSTNPNSAGLASAYLNTGWLFYLKEDQHCEDFFNTSMKYAKKHSLRTFLEAKMGKIMANIKFNKLDERIAVAQLEQVQNQINESNFACRSYAFLKEEASPVDLINKKRMNHI